MLYAGAPDSAVSKIRKCALPELQHAKASTAARHNRALMPGRGCAGSAVAVPATSMAAASVF